MLSIRAGFWDVEPFISDRIIRIDHALALTFLRTVNFPGEDTTSLGTTGGMALFVDIVPDDDFGFHDGSATPGSSRGRRID